MATTMTAITYRLVKGTYAAYDGTANANDVYFATDKKVIIAGGTEYGAGTDLVAKIDKCINKVAFTAPGTFVFTTVDGTGVTHTIPTASATANGLMSKDMVTKLNKAVKTVAFSGNVATLTFVDGTTTTVSIPVATASANGAMSKEQVALLNKSAKGLSFSGNVATLTLNDGKTVTATIPLATTAANGAMSKDHVTKINKTETDLTAFKNTKGKAGGLAELDDTGRVPVSQIPGSVEDIAFFYAQSKAAVVSPRDVTGSSPASGKRVWVKGDHVEYVTAYKNGAGTEKIKCFVLVDSNGAYYESWTVPEGADTPYTSSEYYMNEDRVPYKSVLYVSLFSKEEQYAEGGLIWRYGGGTVGVMVNIAENITVLDLLTSTSKTAALSANQGKVLNDMVQKLVKTVTFTAPGTFNVTLQDGTKTTLTIPTATTTANGLMSADFVKKLNASFKGVAWEASTGKMKFAKTDGTSLDLTVPVASTSAPGLMSAAQVTKLNKVDTLENLSKWYSAT